MAISNVVNQLQIVAVLAESIGIIKVSGFGKCNAPADEQYFDHIFSVFLSYRLTPWIIALTKVVNGL